MAFIVQDTDLVGAGTLINLGEFGDLLLTRGTYIHATSGYAVSGNGSNVVTLNGDVVATTNAIYMTGEDARVVVGSSGSVTNSAGGSTSTGVIIISGNNSTAVNYGLINGGSSLTAIIGTGLQLVNHGQIAGTNALVTDFLGGVSSAGTARFVNTGHATGDDYGARHFNFEAIDSVTLINSGYLGGGLGSYRGGPGTEDITNTGLMDGDVLLEGGNDSFAGFGGTVNGVVFGGTGNDTFEIDQNGAAIDGGVGENDILHLRGDSVQITDIEEVYMQGGAALSLDDDDSATLIRGNAGSNEITGAGGNDTISGRLGDDVLSGGEDDDQIIGNAGDDEIHGDNGADILFGGRGFDEVYGGFGTDQLFGGSGDDTLQGGGAKDTLAGGEGADTFLFESAAEAGSGSGADIINGFVRGDDVIDLQALGTTPASFIGTAGFSGGGNMEVRYTVNAFGNALVRIDEDGNGTEDARIVVSQTALLEASDFLL